MHRAERRGTRCSRTASGFRTRFALLVVAGVIAGCGGSSSHSAPVSTSTPTASPTPAPTQIAGAGLRSDILEASVASDPAGSVSVTFTVTDDNGIPLTATTDSAQSDQEARVRFALAHLEEYAGGGDLGNTFFRYVNEVNATRPAFDSGGTLAVVDAATGTYRYTFATMLPAGFDPTLTYTIAIQVDRDFGAQAYGVDPVFDFVPGGGTPQVRADTTTAQCNSCHAPLIAHGNRREVRLCTTCHTEAAVDEKGESIDFRHMIHKIHAGVDLHLVNDGPTGTAYEIFSSFATPTWCSPRSRPTAASPASRFPRDLEECLTCHAEGPTAEFYRTKASAGACATCHDDVNPSLETDRRRGRPAPTTRPARIADGQCSACHAAHAERGVRHQCAGCARRAGALGAAAGTERHHLRRQQPRPGQQPTITFKITDDAGTPCCAT